MKAKIKAIMKKAAKAQKQLEALAASQQVIYENHSESWRESEAGDEFQENIETVVEAASILEAAIEHVEMGFEIEVVS